MIVNVNNKFEKFPEERLRLTSLLDRLGIKREGTAVSLNAKFISKSEWENQFVEEGDTLTIISAAFGG